MMKPWEVRGTSCIFRDFLYTKRLNLDAHGLTPRQTDKQNFFPATAYVLTENITEEQTYAQRFDTYDSQKHVHDILLFLS